MIERFKSISITVLVLIAGGLIQLSLEWLIGKNIVDPVRIWGFTKVQKIAVPILLVGTGAYFGAHLDKRLGKRKKRQHIVIGSGLFAIFFVSYEFIFRQEKISGSELMFNIGRVISYVSTLLSYGFVMSRLLAASIQDKTK